MTKVHGRKNLHREIFFAVHGFGPFSCWFCGLEVSFLDIHVHHVDHDHSNNEINNLVPTDASCHIKYHVHSRVVSEETRQRNGTAHRGKRRSPEWRRAISEGVKRAWAEGRHDREREMLHQLNARRSTCPGCGFESNTPGIMRHLAGKMNQACREAVPPELEYLLNWKKE